MTMTCEVMSARRSLRYRRRMLHTSSSSPPATAQPVGALLRQWRQRRRLSQLDLATEADISTRHLSCVETGRAEPSRAMLLRLAEQLEVPLRERNVLLTAAGFAPLYRERPLADPALAGARQALDLVLRGHEPYPALLVDRHWNLVAHNRAVPPLLAGIDADMLAPPCNVLRLSVHARGLGPRIANLAQWRGHLLLRLRQQVAASGDAMLQALLEELQAMPLPPGTPTDEPALPDGGVIVPLQVRTPGGTLNLISTTTVFGTPVDITLAELALETFFPADEATAAALRQSFESALVQLPV